jgi:hypothetical protein
MKHIIPRKKYYPSPTPPPPPVILPNNEIDRITDQVVDKLKNKVDKVEEVKK